MKRFKRKGQDLKVRKTFLENRLNEKEIKWSCVTRKHQIRGQGGLQWKEKDLVQEAKL